MNDLFKKWNSINLILRIVCGLVVGIVLAVVVPNLTFFTMLGKLFVGALKGVAPLLVFFLVIAAISKQKDGQETNMKSIVLLYFTGTFLASIVAVVASFAFPTMLSLTAPVEDLAPPSSMGDVISTLFTNILINPVESIATANYIGVLFWAVVIGLALRVASEPTKKVADDVSEALSTVVKWIISFAPFGILGLVYDAISTTGVSALMEYGQLIIVLVSSMLVVALVVNPIICYVQFRKNPYPLIFRCLKESGLTAFFTRSSAANIPVNMQLCEDMGLDSDTYSISIPLGATINMAGAAITINVLTLAAAYTLGVSVTFPMAILLSFVASISACGASGVAGGSLLLIPLACSLFNIPNDVAMQVVGVGFVVGVIQDSCETALNSSTDVVFTASAEYHKKFKQGVNFVVGKKA